ncbi:hypothetical protein [Aliterella atlantica]|uniref:Uncharacterized protein n=1 Tax=Aliterella atlantica CENA595 TaxID=1618023 RepID=A0A0D8ZWZ8_9CYAN|nr:hypothetical protein [Aliterella atlantica]KJH71736.1 hypothetical protein UH38_10065 [Aliterella atlantica CENA595]
MNEMHLVIVNICKITDARIKVSLLLNGKEHWFLIEMCDTDGIKALDFQDNGQFSNILSLDSQKSRYFIKIVFSVYADELVLFPIDLGCFIRE